MFSFKRQIGNQAESIALKHLTQQGLTLIEQNYLTKVGEIDIIMLDKAEQVLVFVEVRYRKNSLFGTAIDSINAAKQTKIIRTASHYLQHQHQFDDFICRFDVIGLESDLKYPKITWIQDAFEG
jgi:putative endonuclease